MSQILTEGKYTKRFDHPILLPTVFCLRPVPWQLNQPILLCFYPSNSGKMDYNNLMGTNFGEQKKKTWTEVEEDQIGLRPSAAMRKKGKDFSAFYVFSRKVAAIKSILEYIESSLLHIKGPNMAFVESKRCRTAERSDRLCNIYKDWGQLIRCLFQYKVF